MNPDTGWRGHLLRAWQGRGLLARLLWPVSLCYAGLRWLHSVLHRLGFKKRYRAPVPVIVVGNVIAGGAGKTPVVIELLRHLQARGWRPGVISRGHGRSSRGVRAVWPDTPASEAGDEPLLIARRAGVPVFVGEKRALAADALLQAHPDTNILVSDDGLQHAALERDIELVLFDERGIGNGWLLPAGPLRQPWSPPSRLDSTGVTHRWLLVHGLDDEAARQLAGALPWWRCHRRLADVAVHSDGSTRPLASFHDMPLAALAGIARPERFFDMLRQRGVRLQHTWSLPDHAPMPSHWPEGSDRYTWLCTEKDAVKWAPKGPAPAAGGVRPQALWAVPLEMTADPGFWDALDARLSSPHGHQTD